MNTTTLSARAVDDFQITQVNGQNGSFASARGSIAVMRPRGRRDGNGNYPTDFFYAEATGRTAEQLALVKKGKKFFAEGYFYNDSYTNKEGQNRTVTRFRIERVERESADVKTTNAQQTQQQFNNPIPNQNVGNMAPTPNPVPQQTQAMNQPTGQAPAPTAPAQQQTVPQGNFNVPAGMPAGQGMPDWSSLDSMPNFELPFV